MSASFHPSDDLLAAYAAGAIDEPTALAIATHLAFCPRCRAEVGRIEARGGACLDALPPAAMADDALSAILARLDREPPAPRPPARGAAASTLPSPLRAYCSGGDPAHLAWRRLSPGIEQAILVRAGQASARLIRIAPGRSTPRHGHGGTEVNVVLTGGYRDEIAHYRPGDFAVASADLLHQPIADEDSPCLCLSVTDGPIRPTGLFARMLMPLFG
jgi:putative transcriptional regulator